MRELNEITGDCYDRLRAYEKTYNACDKNDLEKKRRIIYGYHQQEFKKWKEEFGEK